MYPCWRTDTNWQPTHIHKSKGHRLMLVCKPRAPPTNQPQDMLYRRQNALLEVVFGRQVPCEASKTHSSDSSIWSKDGTGATNKSYTYDPALMWHPAPLSPSLPWRSYLFINAGSKPPLEAGLFTHRLLDVVKVSLCTCLTTALHSGGKRVKTLTVVNWWGSAAQYKRLSVWGETDGVNWEDLQQLELNSRFIALLEIWKGFWRSPFVILWLQALRDVLNEFNDFHQHFACHHLIWHASSFAVVPTMGDHSTPRQTSLHHRFEELLFVLDSV